MFTSQSMGDLVNSHWGVFFPLIGVVLETDVRCVGISGCQLLRPKKNREREKFQYSRAGERHARASPSDIVILK